MGVLSTMNQCTPTKSGNKRALLTSPTTAEKKARKVEDPISSIVLQRPRKPVGEPWPMKDLRAFDAPTEGESEINFGPMLRDVLKARGWLYSTKPCHGTVDKETEVCTFFVKEFEASLLGQKPEKVFGKDGVVKMDTDCKLCHFQSMHSGSWDGCRTECLVPPTKVCDTERTSQESLLSTEISLQESQATIAYVNFLEQKH